MNRTRHFLPRRALSLLLSPILVTTSLLASPAIAQEKPQASDLLQRIFGGNEFQGRFGAAGRWIEDGNAYLAMEPVSGQQGAQEIVRYSTEDGKREVFVSAAQLTPPGAKAPLRVASYSWSADMKRLLLFTNTKRVWRQNTRGDYWILDRDTNKLRQLGGDAPSSTLMYAKFSPDASKVAYVRENNIYVEDVAGGAITQLTKDGSQWIVNGAMDWVYEEELGLHDGFRWSPDGHDLAFWQFDMHGVGNFPLIYYLGTVRDVVTNFPYPEAGKYPVLLDVPYPLAGTPNSAVRIGVVSANGGDIRWMQIPGDPRDNYIARMDWSGNSKELLIQHLDRLQNANGLLLADAATGVVREIYQDQDAAFVDVHEIELLDGGAEFLLLSEKDGWRHAYRIGRDGNKEQLITRGDMDVVSISGVDEKGGWLYFIASPENPTQRYLYRAPLDGKGDPARVTPAATPGNHGYNVSPNGRWAFHTYSSADSPPMTELVQLPEHRTVRVIDDNAAVRAKVAPLITSPTEFFRVDAGEGLMVDGWIIKPPNFDASKKYPILVYVYGEPAGQTVADTWGGSRGLFHRAIAQQGYLVASFDNAGTPAPLGRAWRKAIYGTVGVGSSKQQATALRSLAKSRPYIDLDRVAVWGWSGGGTNTLNLIFRSPELYKVGMSVAPVPDQRLYDSIYQERYMGLPQQNAEGYRTGSAINFAEGLRGNLLIVHGSGDDNVHYQGTELLVNRLIELGKPFDFMTYPDRSHGISEGKGTSLHVHRLLMRYLKEHLAAGPMPMGAAAAKSGGQN